MVRVSGFLNSLASFWAQLRIVCVQVNSQISGGYVFNLHFVFVQVKSLLRGISKRAREPISVMDTARALSHSIAAGIYPLEKVTFQYSTYIFYIYLILKSSCHLDKVSTEDSP